MKTYRVLAPAKVNLTLHVLAKRTDGYHELASLFVPVSVFDHLTVRVGGRRTAVKVPNARELEGDDNLCAKAARAFAARTGLPANVQVTLEKRIPVAAGLGGGSSDAAAVLRVLCRHHGISIGEAEVAEAALEVGSDVPFFLKCTPSIARGRGELLEPAPELPRLHLVIVKPPFGISAGEAYKRLAKGRESGAIPAGHEVKLKRAYADARSVARILHNDLAAGLATAFPIDDLRGRLLSAGARGALLSGSGSCVFGLADDARAARKCARSLEIGDGEEVLLARSLRRHPGVRDA